MSTSNTKDTYQIISTTSQGEYKEKGSKFISYAFPVKDIETVETCLLQIKDLHHKARHHCYAYRIGLEGDLYRANDDGEPSGTAGKPILGQMLSHEVSDVLVIVVRYFGGTKLGASGLITAYKSATSEALTLADKAMRTLCDIYRLTFDYGEMGHVMNVIKSLELEIVDKVFDAAAYVDIEVPQGVVEDTLVSLKASLLKISTDQIDDKTIVPFCSIEKIKSI